METSREPSQDNAFLKRDGRYLCERQRVRVSNRNFSDVGQLPIVSRALRQDIQLTSITMHTVNYAKSCRCSRNRVTRRAVAKVGVCVGTEERESARAVNNIYITLHKNHCATHVEVTGVSPVLTETENLSGILLSKVQSVLSSLKCYTHNCRSSYKHSICIQ